MDNFWHTQKIEAVFEKLGATERGLTSQDAENRLQQYGPNKLPEAKTDSLAAIFLRQFRSPLIYILLAASIIVFLIGETVDSIIIFAVLIFNAIVGTVQEGRAQNTLAALKKFVETAATVLRDNKEVIISDKGLVPGDIIFLQEGEKVPADARLLSVNNLKIDEASLTGELDVVSKIADPLHEKDLPIAEQKNIVFKGTYVATGEGLAVVVATGSETVIGKISQTIAAIDTDIPLKVNIRELSRLIIVAVSAISVILFALGIYFGKSAREMFATVVSLAVSIIPEGLPIVMTLVLAAGVWRMSKRNVLVKKLQAVEALGQARVIAVDKTGTITKNEMAVRQIYADGKFFEVYGGGYEPKGSIKLEKKTVEPLNHPELIMVGKIAALCSNARLAFSQENKEWRISGDPTEAAMLALSQKIGFNREVLEEESPKISEILFDYKNKYHAVAHNLDGKKIFLVAGAPEVVLAYCKAVWQAGRSNSLTKEGKENLWNVLIRMSQKGLRIIALATGPVASDAGIGNLSFVGFLGLKDSLRPEVHPAMQRAMAADIRVIMITGDHKSTAEAIAREAGIFKPGDRVLTGEEINDLSDETLMEELPKTSVFARVTPEHKMRIINAFRQKGEIVAMTGDGVNDAPSLVAADLGVSMGKIGTEVAKSAADLVLLDDDFGSIISAVEEGRSIYKTIKRVILYLFSTSLGEVFTIAGALLLGYPLPILAAQIVWLNFVTDGFLDVALAMEPKEKGLLLRSFERPKKYLLDKLTFFRMLLMALPMTVGALWLFQRYFQMDIVKGWTVSLTVLAMFQWFNAWNCRSEDKSIFQLNPFSNKFLASATLIVIFLQVFVIYNPWGQRILHLTPLGINDWLLIGVIAASIIFVEEMRKLFFRKAV